MARQFRRAPDEAGEYDNVVPQQGGGYYNVFPQRRARKNAEAQRAETRAALEGHDFGLDEFVRGGATPEQAAALQEELDRYKEWAMRDDPGWQQAGREGLAEMSREFRAAHESRRVEQSGVVLGALEDQRKRHVEASKKQSTIHAGFSEAAAILADPDSDVNNNLTRDRLMASIETGPRSLFADPEDMAEALKAGGAGVPLIGAFMSLFAGTMAAEDFIFSKEDWRKARRGAYIAQSTPYLEESQKIAQSTQQLEQVAGGLGMFPKGYSALPYVLEQQQDFTNPFNDVANSYPEQPRAVESPSSVAAKVGGGLRDMLNDNAAKVSAEREAEQAALDVPAELAEDKDGWLTMEGYYEPYRREGAKIMIDRRSGAAYAEYSDGRQVPLEQNAFAKLRNKKRVYDQEHGELQ